MQEEAFQKALRSVLGPSSREQVGFAAGRAGAKKLFQSGTTILAMQYDGGVLCAGDRQTSGGTSILKDDTTKIEQVGLLSMAGGAGLVSAIQYVRKKLQEKNANFYGLAGIPLSLAGQANFLSALIRGLRLSEIDEDFYSTFILAGCRIGDGGFDIWEVDGIGGQYNYNYSAIGSGSDSAMPVLKDRRHGWKPEMKLKGALDLAFRALFTAGKLDAMTSDAEVVLPVMAVVSDKGFRYVNPKVVARLRAKHLGAKP